MSVRRRIARSIAQETEEAPSTLPSTATIVRRYEDRVEMDDRANVNPNDWLFSFEELHGSYSYPKPEVK